MLVSGAGSAIFWGMENKPSVGQLITVRGIACRIVKVRPFGTLDVASLCGNYAFRVSGLSF